MINYQEALVYTMVLISAADREMRDSELREIGEIVSYLPVFADFDQNQLPDVARDCANLLNEDDGFNRALDLIRKALTKKLRETAYALACDVAVADGRLSQEEHCLLELLRHQLRLDRLSAAAIERGARARHATA